MQLKNLKTNYLGKSAFFFEEIDSTQKEVWRRVEKNNIENGTVIYANLQTAGIGTHGRVWHTDEKGSIAFSFFIDLNCNIKKLDGLTLKIAEIIVQIFQEKYNIFLEIKEPNDIYYNGKKLGGILTETKVASDIVKKLVVGIGINTNKKTFAGDIEKTATSIVNEFGICVDTEEFISEFCNKFEKESAK